MRTEGAALGTTGDTEVALRSLIQWGDAALDRWEGMWAFALFDETKDELILARDRFGEKPLYICRDATGIWFGSEVKFIQALRGRSLEVNLPQVFRFLVNGYKALHKQPETFFRDVQPLEPGTLMRCGPDGSGTVARYWQPDLSRQTPMSFAQAVEGVRERLIDSVGLCLRADVPVAFCMSGGIDSNSLIGIATSVFGYDAHGFTVVNRDTRYEESDLVDAAVRAYGIRHTSLVVDHGGFLDRLQALVHLHDAPVHTISYYVHWLLMEQVAAAGYRVSVSGTGADELFSGYHDHHNAYLYEVHDEPQAHAEALTFWKEHQARIVRNPFLKDPDLFVRDPGFRGHIYLDADRFAGWLTRPWHEPFREERYVPGVLRNRMMNELFHEAVPCLLHEDDLNAMSWSVENRSPFLNRRLFEFAATIPTPLLFRNGYAKAVLREAMRGTVPDAILDSRRKVGFNAPIADLLNLNDPEVRAAILDDSPIYEHVRRDRIEVLLAEPELPNSRSKFLFSFLCSKFFLERFAGNGQI